MFDIAGAFRFKDWLDLCSQYIVKLSHQFNQVDHATAGHVKEATRHSRGSHGAQIGIDDIADVNEIAGLRAVTKEDWSVTAQHAFNKSGNDSGVFGTRVLARAKDIKI